jgi:gas vesicle protein
MEFFLIIIIVILVYLLFKKKSSNNLKQDLDKEAKAYGKAFKKAGSSFINTLKDEKNRNENITKNQTSDEELSDEEINKMMSEESEKNNEEYFSNVKNVVVKFLTSQIEETFFYEKISFETFRDKVLDDKSLACISATLNSYLQYLSPVEEAENEMDKKFIEEREVRRHTMVVSVMIEILEYIYDSYDKDKKENNSEIIKFSTDALHRVHDLSPNNEEFNLISNEMGKQVFDWLKTKKKAPTEWIKNLR